MTLKPKEEIVVDETITLRRFSHEYNQQRYDAIITSRKQLLPWLSWAHFYQTFDEMPKFIDGQIESFDKGEKFGYDIIVDGKFAGAIDLHNISEDNHSCEIGYWLNEKYTGKGIMSRCAAKITEYAFNEIDMHRVVIEAAAANKASCAVAERIGFTLEGTLRDHELLDGKYYDTNIYAKLNPLHVRQ